MYHSTLGSTVIKKKKKVKAGDHIGIDRGKPLDDRALSRAVARLPAGGVRVEGYWSRVEGDS